MEKTSPRITQADLEDIYKRERKIVANVYDQTQKQVYEMKQQLEAKRNKGLLQAPDPVVFHHDSPVKAMLVLDDVLLTGNDAGEISVIDKASFKLLARQICVEAPILKIAKEQYAVIVKYKDAAGTIAVLQYYKSSAAVHQIKLISKIETQFVGFTTFATCSLQTKTKAAFTNHICVLAPCSVEQHFPKVWLLAPACDRVQHSQTLRVLPNQLEEAAATGAKAGKAPGVKNNREGNITQIVVVDKRLDAEKLLLLKINGQDDDPQLTEDAHEVYLGFESGAIGIFSMRMSRDDNEPYKVETRVMISAQRFSSD